MAVLRCKMCGGDLEITEGVSSCTCEFCGTEQTIPTVKDENLQGLFNRANVLRMKSEFDKASEIYEKILQNRETESEAYWGLILCKYGIEYVEDPKTFKRIPTCHRTSYDALTADEDYKNAIKYADVVQKSIYEAEAKAIDEVQKGILAISQKETPYDVFICYKETDDSGKRTIDSTIANDIYYQLTQEGFKVFYAAITLEDKLGTEYEPYIFSALNTAKVMLALGTKPEHFNAVWVKNEWSRFLKIMKQDRAKMLIPCYRDMDAYELPEEFAHLQAQDMSKIGFINDLVRGIKKVIAKDSSSAEKESADMQQSAGNNASVNALLDRGNMALEDEEWDKANEYFEQVLNFDARCGEAYLGRVLAENRTSSIDGFVNNCLQYYSGTKRSYKACDIDNDTIEKTIAKYTLDGYLKAETIRKLFDYNLEYKTDIKEREDNLKEAKKYLKSDKIIKRVLQFLSGEKKENFTAAVEKIESELQQTLEHSKAEAANKKSDIINNYAAHVQATVKKIEAMYADALLKREEDHQRNMVVVEKKRQEIEAEKEKDYQKTVALEKSASTDLEYDSVAARYEKFGDYKDAKERATDCRYIASKMRIDAGKAKTRKIVIVSSIVVAVIAITVIVLIIVDSRQKQKAYKYAISMYENEKFDEATKMFEKLGGYKDSDSYIKEIQLEKEYKEACKSFDDRDYESAGDIFKKLGEYSDAQAKYLECIYREACQLMESKSYSSAIELFDKLGTYQDSAEKSEKCKLLKEKKDKKDAIKNFNFHYLMQHLDDFECLSGPKIKSIILGKWRYRMRDLDETKKMKITDTKIIYYNEEFSGGKWVVNYTIEKECIIVSVLSEAYYIYDLGDGRHYLEVNPSKYGDHVSIMWKK